MQPHYWDDAKKHLSARCPTMKRLISHYEGEGLRARGDGFYTLVRSVIGQQISVKAADAVWARLTKAVKPLTPEKLLATSDEKLRACGLSASKVAYAKNVAEFFVERGIAAERTSPSEGGGTLREAAYWSQFTDDEVIAQLTAIKGIGVWTAEMFLIFHLMRPDVFPVKDLGVLRAMNLHVVDGKKLKTEKWLKPKEYQDIAARWQPYRTVATWYLWRALDPVAVEY